MLRNLIMSPSWFELIQRPSIELLSTSNMPTLSPGALEPGLPIPPHVWCLGVSVGHQSSASQTATSGSRPGSFNSSKRAEEVAASEPQVPRPPTKAGIQDVQEKWGVAAEFLLLLVTTHQGHLWLYSACLSHDTSHLGSAMGPRNVGF